MWQPAYDQSSEPPASVGGREWLYAVLHELKRGDLQLGAVDYARVDRVLMQLAVRGIRPDDPRAADFLGPVLCSSPSEQAFFRARFAELADLRRPSGADSRPAPDERVSEPNRTGRGSAATRIAGRRSSVYAVLVLAAVAVAGAWIYLDELASVLEKLVGVDLGEFKRQVPPVPRVITPVDLIGRPLALVPLVIAAMVVWWRHARRLWLVHGLVPSFERAEKVAFATGAHTLYSGLALKRALMALHRHKASLGGRLDVKRTVRATLRACGRPELKFGTRPRTPEYVLLVDREGPRDHLAAAADLLLTQFLREGIVVTRYDYFGDPRRVVRPAVSGRGAQHLRLADLRAIHADHDVLIVADPQSFFDRRGSLRAWIADVRDWGRPVLLSPKAEVNWGWAERVLEREGILILPATPLGIAGYAERLKLGSGVPFARWHRVPDPKIDVALQLDAHRDLLLDDSAPPGAVVEQFLVDLRVWLGSEAFALLQALAVFPRLEPALTLHLGNNLRDENGRPLLDEARLLALSRLPWLRAGRIPDWLRNALVGRMDTQQLDRVLQLLAAFLQPLENPRTGAVTFEISQQPNRGLRSALLDWITGNPLSELDDRILVDALRGGEPRSLAVEVPPSLASRLRSMVTADDRRILATAAIATILLGLFYVPTLGLLNSAWALIGGLSYAPALISGWIALAIAFVFWQAACYEARLLFARTALVLNALSLLVGLLFAFGSNTPTAAGGRILMTASGLMLALLYLSGNIVGRQFRKPVELLALNWTTLGIVFFSLSLIGPAFTITKWAFHDWSAPADQIIVAELSAQLAAMLSVLVAIYSHPHLERFPLSEALRYAATFALGQTLIPLSTAGVTLLLPEQARSAADHSNVIILAYTFTRYLSGYACLSAVLLTKTRQFEWTSSFPLFVPSAAAAVSLFLAPSARDTFGFTGLAVAASLSSLVYMRRAALQAAALPLPAMHNAHKVAIGAAVFLPLLAAAASPPLRYLQSALLVVLAAAFSKTEQLSLAKEYLTRSAPQREQVPWRVAAARLWGAAKAAMPWSLLPVLWLLQCRVSLPSLGVWPFERQTLLSFTEILIPVSVWLASRYPRQVDSLLLAGGLIGPVSLGIGPVSIGGRLDTVIASVIIARLIVDRDLIEGCARANAASMRQVAFLVIGLGVSVFFGNGSIGVAWMPDDMRAISFFVVGMSRIRLWPFVILTTSAALVWPPLTSYFGFSSAVGGDAVRFIGISDHPAPWIDALVSLVLGRGLRSLWAGPGLLQNHKSDARTWGLTLWAGILSILLVASRMVGYVYAIPGGGTITWYNLLDSTSILLFFFWIGVKYGRSAALAAFVGFGMAEVLLFFVMPTLQLPAKMFGSTFEVASWHLPFVPAFGVTVLLQPGARFLNDAPAYVAFAMLGWRLRRRGTA